MPLHHLSSADSAAQEKPWSEDPYVAEDNGRGCHAFRSCWAWAEHAAAAGIWDLPAWGVTVAAIAASRMECSGGYSHGQRTHGSRLAQVVRDEAALDPWPLGAQTGLRRRHQ